MLINVNATKASQRIQPNRLFKLPQDIKQIDSKKQKPLTKDELDAVLKEWDNTLSKGKISKM